MPARAPLPFVLEWGLHRLAPRPAAVPHGREPWAWVRSVTAGAAVASAAVDVATIVAEVNATMVAGTAVFTWHFCRRASWWFDLMSCSLGAAGYDWFWLAKLI